MNLKIDDIEELAVLLARIDVRATSSIHDTASALRDDMAAIQEYAGEARAVLKRAQNREEPSVTP